MKKKTQKAKKTIKFLTVSKKKDLLWGGAQKVMGKPRTETQRQERNVIMLTAKALGISPFGITLFASYPYINKLGLKEKQEQYAPRAKILYNWTQKALDDNQKAICEAKIVDVKGKDLCDWITGECSPKTIKMGTLAGYQNHMAQTRAKNRAILEVYGVRIHEEMMSNIEKMIRERKISEAEASQVGNAIVASAEEIQENGGQRKAKRIVAEPFTPGSNFVANSAKLRNALKGNTDGEKLLDLQKKTGIKLGSLNAITESYAGELLIRVLRAK